MLHLRKSLTENSLRADVPLDVAVICSLQEVDRKKQRGKRISFLVFLARKSPYPFLIPFLSRHPDGEVLRRGERSGEASYFVLGGAVSSTSPEAVQLNLGSSWSLAGTSFHQDGQQFHETKNKTEMNMTYRLLFPDSCSVQVTRNALQSLYY
jgi:hypothetical protein